LNKKASKVVTVSLTCALESIEKLKLKKIEREKLTQKLILVVGLLVGIGFGYLTYLLGNKYITGNIKTKKDDDAPL
jgi:coenzyme F420-reducing hydrogenase beta subunit